MPDISHTIVAKSDQLNAADLAQPITVTVRGVHVTRDDQPVIVDIGDQHQPWKPCKGMRRLLAQVWGLNTDTWPGERVTLYCDPEATWGGQKVGGIRVSAISGIDSRLRYVMRTSKKGTTTYDVSPLEKVKPVDPAAARGKLLSTAQDKHGLSADDIAAWLGEQGGATLDQMTVDDLRGLFRALPDIAAWRDAQTAAPANQAPEQPDDGGELV